MDTPGTRLFNVREGEAPIVVAGLALFFLLFTGYFMLRPVRETMGVAGGVENLQWLFTGTFVLTLIALPLFGWLASKVQRRRILPWTYGFLASNLLVFAALFALQPDNLWSARAFYIWLSMFNLLSISLAWSVLADLFSSEQAKRLFGLLAAGASLGGLLGPLLGTLLVGVIGHAGLVLLATACLLGSVVAVAFVQRFRDRHPLPADTELPRSRPLGGNPFAGASEVFRSPYLLAIALFVVLLASVSTFLYFEQARLVAEHFSSRTEQTQVFGLIDTLVQLFVDPDSGVHHRASGSQAGCRCFAGGGAVGDGGRFCLAGDGAVVCGVCGGNGGAQGRGVCVGAARAGDALYRGGAGA